MVVIYSQIGKSCPPLDRRDPPRREQGQDCVWPYGGMSVQAQRLLRLSNAPPELARPRSPQVPPRHLRELRERHLRLLDLRMPALLPLEAEVPAVPDLHERLDLPLHRHLAR